MKKKVQIRESKPTDINNIEWLYPQAFPDEDLVPLVRSLLQEAVDVLSLVATINSQLVGHVIFTKCRVIGCTGEAVLLGPLGVKPAWQGQWIGSLLAHTGMRQLSAAGITQVFVLGDPAYYKHLGFLTESHVTPPFELPPEWREAWQSKRLNPEEPELSGQLSLPQQWLQPALWAQ